MKIPGPSVFRRAGAVALVVALLALADISGCGGGNGGNGSSPANGSVVLFLTDSLSSYQQVTATVTKVQMLHADRSSRCDLLSEPVTVNIANLADTVQLLDRTSCPAGNYTRLFIEVEAPVQLVDLSGNASSCRFVSYLDDADVPNALSCDPATDRCGFDIRGAVRASSLTIASDITNIAGLDFDLKKFEVEHFGDPAACAVTMKVTPVHGASLKRLMRNEGITGTVSDLNIAAQTFVLTRRNMMFTVNFSGVNAARQPGLDVLLLQAQTDGLPVRVISTSVDLAEMTIDATSVFVKISGTVSDIGPRARSFVLHYGSGSTKTIDCSPPARVSGTLADGARAEVALRGSDSVTGDGIAQSVEVRQSGTETDD